MATEDIKLPQSESPKEFIMKKTNSFDLTSKLSFFGGAIGLGYALYSGKSKILFIVIGAVGGSLLNRVINKNTK